MLRRQSTGVKERYICKRVWKREGKRQGVSREKEKGRARTREEKRVRERNRKNK